MTAYRRASDGVWRPADQSEQPPERQRGWPSGGIDWECRHSVHGHAASAYRCDRLVGHVAARSQLGLLVKQAVVHAWLAATGGRRR